jgi:O-antigen ligase
MKIIRIVLLVLILWNLPAIALLTMGPSLGSRLSYITIGLLAIYYFFEIKTTPNWWIIILALSYFIISSLQYYGPPIDFTLELIKYFIFVIGGYELVKRVSKEELFFFLLLGALSVAFEAVLFPSAFGRYSGFYLNANEAGFVCVYGYALVYSLKNTSIKLLGQFVFTLMGLLTFSRTFIIIWLFINIISLKISIKNIKVLGIGILIFSTLLFIDESVGLNNPRFEQLKKIVNNETVSVNEVSEDSRMSTWSKFYDVILESPIFGNGYGTLSGKLGYGGVHNTYLMIIGEAGIIPFVLLLAYICYLFYWSICFFKTTPYLIMQTVALALFLLTDHNFFVSYYLVFGAMWIQYQIVVQKKLLFGTENQIENEKLET